MASYNSKNRESEYSRTYKSTRGVDRTGTSSPTERYRSVKNMFVDYERGGDCIESLPGYRRLCNLSGRINGIFRHAASGVEYIIVHAGNTLYKARLSDIDNDGAFSTIATISDNPSSAFTYKDRLFILDGEGIYTLDQGVTFSSFAALSGYVPTTYLNGVKNERRNMLSPLSLERYKISASEDYLYESAGIKYSVLDAKEKYCCVSGFSGQISGALYIPRYADIGGVRYEITEIADYALRNQTSLTALYTSAGLKRVGKSALRGCTSLALAQLSTTVETIDEYSFYGCSSLTTVYFGESMSQVGGASFGYCQSLATINYERDLASYNAIAGTGAIPDSVVIRPFTEYTAIKLGFPLFGSIASISGVYHNERVCPYSYESSRRTICVDFNSKSECDGGDFKIYVANERSAEDGDFSRSSYFDTVAPRNAILGCTVGEVFDGRVFLSGNPTLPGAVFYSGIDITENNNYTYFRECDYFVDGEGREGISSMLPLTDSLLVFRRGNSTAGSIFYHKIDPKGGYPVYYVHRGIWVLGKSYSLYDDALFLSPDGVCTILKEVYADYNKLSTCTQGIMGDLDIGYDTRFDFALFKGYIVIIVGDKMYLGDLKRTYKQGESVSYEWYETEGIGEYSSDTAVYRYSAGYESLDELTEKIGKVAEGTVINQVLESGASVYYVETDGKRYAVLPTEERTGGRFYPATTLLSAGGLLFFGTDSGAVCVFNTDKIGEPPSHIQSEAGFDAEEYARSFGNRLHPYYYSFMGHAPLCEIESYEDDLDAVSLTKTTVKGTFGVTLKAVGEALPELYVSTDGSEYKKIPLAARRYGTPSRFKVMAEERERGYIEKKFKISSSEYLSPFGVYSLEYRYKIKGRMKK